MNINPNIISQSYAISKEDRQAKNKHRSFVIWLTGLSGSGKSTLANALDQYFFNNGLSSYVLDGDNIRQGLNKNLGFSPADRKENIRRVGEVSKLFVSAGLISIAAFISPYLEDRVEVREMFSEKEFIEVFVNCPLELCEKRDPKGLYRKARNGQLQQFTGISSPYEESIEPEIEIRTDQLSVEEGVSKIISFLKGQVLI
ncbi:adenylyl-sulfate kinase [Cohnella yongneupensis]|uniref:Adenylyl-sulfate kinase n=1 Tax=Cohnella yongneupensis TaxID=425006 RepID=A0ABW0R3H4_9BACL